MDLGGTRERAVLAVLLLSANQVVSVDRLVDELWGEHPPETAIPTLRVFVSRLRKALRQPGETEVILTQPPGYVARVDPSAVDLTRFEALAAQGRAQLAAGDAETAAVTLREALSLWRGEALSDLGDAPVTKAAAARLEEERLATLEERVEADLASGRHRELVAELEALTTAYPLRERLWAHRMMALYRCGRQAEAVRAYQEIRALLAEDLGLEPTTALRQLEAAILRHDPELERTPPAARRLHRGRRPPGQQLAASCGVMTFLFTDIVASTSLLDRVGDATAEEVRRRHFAIMRRAVSDAGGHEVKSLGDGLMVSFTSPLAAVRCAVAMQRAVTQPSSVPEAVAIRIGLHVGEPVTEKDDFFGRAVVVAKRLCDQAAPGEILASGLVVGLIGPQTGVRFGEVRRTFLKGLSDPIDAVAVEWQDHEPGASTVGRGSGDQAAREPVATPPQPSFLTGSGHVFVGRDAELERLRELWAAALDGRRQVALVAGEPGIGKTRLAAEFAGWVAASGAVVLAGRCDEDLGVPYQPFVEGLRHFIDHRTDEQLDRELGRYGGDLARLVPELQQRAPGLPPALSSDPETERYRLFDAVADWLATITSNAPVLLVLDDLQWATKPTLLLLRHVARAATPMRLLVLGIYRDTDVADGHPLTDVLADLRRGPGSVRLPLTGLDERGVARFVEATAGHDLDDDDRDVVRALHEGTDGNPFFVEELLRHLVETGMVTHHDGRWVITGSLAGIRIPEGVQEVVGRRLSRLSSTAASLLAIAAVTGVRFEVDVVRRVSELPEDLVIDGLEEASRARLIVALPGLRLQFRFAHALVRSVLYDHLSLPRRCSLHHSVGEAIEAIHGHNPEGHLSALAHHFISAAPAGADVVKAVDYCTRAGRRAVMQLAHHEAAAYYRQALDLLDAPGGVRDQHDRVDLLISLGESQRRAGDPAYRETLLEAARAAKHRGDRDALARAALANSRGPLFSAAAEVDAERVSALEDALRAVSGEESPVRARLLASLALELTWAPRERGRRIRLTEEALALARQTNDSETLAHVLLARQYAVWGPDTLPRRLGETGELMSLAEQVGDPVLICRAAFVRFRASLEDGGVAEANRCLERNAALVAELGQPALRWLMALNQTGAALLTGQLAQAERLAEETWDLGRNSGQPDARLFSGLHRIQLRFEQGRLAEDEAWAWRTVIEPYLGAPTAFPTVPALGAWLALEVGRLDEARRRFDALFAVALEPGATDAVWLRGVTDAATVCAALGDTARATFLYDLLLPYTGQFPLFGVSLVAGCADHSLGVLARTLGRLEAAAAHFADATALHEQIGAPTWLARTQLERARLLLLHPGRRPVAEARALVAQVLTTARELGLRGVERQATALFDQTARNPPLPPIEGRVGSRGT